MARYAWPEVIVIAVLGVLLIAGAIAYLHWSAALPPAALMIFLLSFYRDPPRHIPPGANLLVSPADGKVVEVQHDMQPAGGGSLRILIFLSVFNVHVNRCPCAGRIVAIDYRAGKFLNALKSESTTLNESNTLTIEPTAPLPGPIRVKQIAGVLARRIVCATRIGVAVAAGERFGMIKLGSRTELTAPADARWEVLVRVGDTVRGGATILARLRVNPASV